MIDTVAVDGWAVTFGTARRGPPINGQCTKFDVAFASGVKRVKINSLSDKIAIHKAQNVQKIRQLKIGHMMPPLVHV